MSPSRESHLVELVDETGQPIGSTTVATAHQPPAGCIVPSPCCWWHRTVGCCCNVEPR